MVSDIESAKKKKPAWVGVVIKLLTAVAIAVSGYWIGSEDGEETSEACEKCKVEAMEELKARGIEYLDDLLKEKS